jgi:hypothetical protein
MMALKDIGNPENLFYVYRSKLEYGAVTFIQHLLSHAKVLGMYGESGRTTYFVVRGLPQYKDKIDKALQVYRQPIDPNTPKGDLELLDSKEKKLEVLFALGLVEKDGTQFRLTQKAREHFEL